MRQVGRVGKEGRKRETVDSIWGKRAFRPHHLSREGRGTCELERFFSVVPRWGREAKGIWK